MRMPEHVCLSRGVRHNIVYSVSSVRSSSRVYGAPKEAWYIHFHGFFFFIVLTQRTRVVDFVNKVEWLMGTPF